MSIKKTFHKMGNKFKYSVRVLFHHLWRVPHKKMHVFLAIAALCLFGGGLVALWLSTLTIPNLDSFSTRRIAQSTKIYDRTGKILLYDLNQGIKRTLVPSGQISDNIKKAAVSIEDAGFYQNNGIEPYAILRAIFDNVKSGCFTCGQGGSTITQQLVKNALLTGDRAISRKLKEWVLALKIEKVMTKDEILTLYLNESPFGGQIYGVEEASEEYYGKHASEVSVAQAAYLAAMLQAPTHYSPYGAHRDELNARQKLVLKRMLDEKNISKDEYSAALAENVQFLPQETSGIKAPHFVNFVIDKLHDSYDDTELASGGFRVITTLNYDLESKAEALTKQYALQNEQTYKAKNAALVAIDPQSGNILAMVGSRDYFDKEIDGNFNIATAYRQPGSTFKPIVYATAFEKGYEPQTVVFDSPTEFSTNCPPETALILVDGTAAGAADAGSCYHPVDFDGQFLGPMDLRHALAQSRNIPAIKMLYLAGISDSLKTARNLGITSLNNANDYGLTLVLGGGEVSPLELTSAYGTFANGGVHVPYNSILQIQDKDGNVLKDFSSDYAGTQALPKQVALKIADVLSDYPAKDPNEFLHFPDQDVAAKTGTTNNYRDAWIMGFTPNLAVGVWAGNNDNTPMDKKVAGYVAAPLWSAFMHQAIATLPVESFEKPAPEDLSAVKPIIRGGWQGGTSYFIDKVTGKLATEFTPADQREEKFTGGIHDILYYVNKDDPLGPAPANPNDDPQYARWEYGAQLWLTEHPEYNVQNTIPTGIDDVHNPANNPVISVSTPNSTVLYEPSDRITIQIGSSGKYPLAKVDYYINENYLGESSQYPFALSFVPSDLPNTQAQNTLRAVATDSVGNVGQTSMQFQVDTAAN